MADDNLMSLQPGTVIAGRYEVVKCLGAGSMGLVYACRHRELSGHLVAVKVLFPEVAQDRVAAARFRNEIFASYGVSHPNVVRAYEYIRDGDLVAYTMEFVGGGDLADKLNSNGKLMPINEIVRLLIQMCGGVQAIHDAGIVHRDLKPENILLTSDGQVKIADFGIARTGHGPKLTEHGGVVGTIHYVSPEYILNSHVDWRSDIYALGILAYEMFTGDSPFQGDSVYATMTKRLKFDPPPPSSIRSECPKELDHVVLKALVREPEARYQAALDMQRDLQIVPAVSDTKATSTSISVHQDLTSSRGGDSPKITGGDGDDINRNEFVASPHQPGSDYPDRNHLAEVIAHRGASSHGDNDSARESRDTSEASEIDRGLVDLAESFSEPMIETKRMESVLTHRMDPVVERSRKAAMRGGSISSRMDQERIRQLSRSVQRRSRPAWFDIVLVIGMIVIGIAIGFVFLGIFIPDVLDSSLLGKVGL